MCVCVCCYCFYVWLQHFTHESIPRLCSGRSWLHIGLIKTVSLYKTIWGIGSSFQPQRDTKISKYCAHTHVVHNNKNQKKTEEFCPNPSVCCLIFFLNFKSFVIFYWSNFDRFFFISISHEAVLSGSSLNLNVFIVFCDFIEKTKTRFLVIEFAKIFLRWS